MTSAVINFTQEIPRLGDNVVVQETPSAIQRKLIIADRNSHTTISATTPDGKKIILPVTMVGAVQER